MEGCELKGPWAMLNPTEESRVGWKGNSGFARGSPTTPSPTRAQPERSARRCVQTCDDREILTSETHNRVVELHRIKKWGHRRTLEWAPFVLAALHPAEKSVHVLSPPWPAPRRAHRSPTSSPGPCLAPTRGSLGAFPCDLGKRPILTCPSVQQPCKRHGKEEELGALWGVRWTGLGETCPPWAGLFLKSNYWQGRGQILHSSVKESG